MAVAVTPAIYKWINGAFQRFVKGASVRVEKFADRALSQLQDNLVAAIRELQVNPIGNGNLFTDVPFTINTDLQIAHLLDRNYRGFIVTRQASGGTATRVTERDQADGLSSKFITLRANATCVLDVYVF